jgi:hypothetical protein
MTANLTLAKLVQPRRDALLVKRFELVERERAVADQGKGDLDLALVKWVRDNEVLVRLDLRVGALEPTRGTRKFH